MAETPVWLLFMAFSSLPLLPWCKGGDEAAVKGMFVFGSSLVDNGNNNFLRNSKARADYSPYGIDFPWGPSGRFSNGRNPVDVLGQLLMLPSLIPPFADPETKGRRIAHGVNYASGGSGILDHTGSLAGEVMNLSSQIGNFEDKTLPELKAQLGKGGSRRVVANRFLSQYLFVVGTGGNDYLLNFFAGDAKNSTTMSEFTHHLVSIFSAQLKKLYDLGARKFVLFSIQAMGCVPVVRATVPTANGGCVEAMNEAAILFNSHLRRLADASRRRRMPGSFVVFVSGFSETSEACCELSSAMEDGRGILCRRGGRACGDRDAHVFFDGLHPTDAVNMRIAVKAYGSNLKAEAYPINVGQLARLSV
ncbi:hypothetical protein OPV22_027031 [Ensete ventricosum]|uniref:SGNH hydrolase-type esterase domain-containing protein n=1 Tax=Ensete ventricosum TaxID=4639 RepID=A0AAV8PZB3_ENSVE|nr:hypothetical protein OPV22_027031 [Ensete ventricosum]